ncbi:putative protein kinase CK2beta regulatory subunit [Monocercomonoides exilis]|uniref:putative protein kinase CK2beta regulatory subunit n=1 Tax=Monocercomonoides exilis TaxID=2049356 RepID=UPI00355A0FB9|nr:putative protein kinase CK2beta regulatory subunit [Monocercomonoides exilis]|eukprot:MONOS_8664.1-p1 / transcript=MONOS_8664.1 / gene=MONOS_8664 / organism=Monocercomonoides_exilis_PA203 / gene_product=protein kinase CK2beta regulatory subunit / transcript_product=protein kinase CK2beta regulatory subunit / location=Mono_scaffold00332:59803-60885(+) / protein_length=341 / sequence_SO=supercontig / SO=protein_coding / is_pseudo=false
MSRKGQMYSDDNSDNSSSEMPWIEWFCSARGHEFFVEVPRSFIETPGNTSGLVNKAPHFQRAFQEILDYNVSDEEDDDAQSEEIEIATEQLYYMIHARYILTLNGLKAMKEKYERNVFGTCPLLICNGCPVLPVGKTLECGSDNVMLYCPSCESIYVPSSRRHHAIDGAAFGPSFPLAFFQQFPWLMMKKPLGFLRPKMYGFRVFTGKHSTLSGYLAAREEFKAVEEEEGKALLKKGVETVHKQVMGALPPPKETASDATPTSSSSSVTPSPVPSPVETPSTKSVARSSAAIKNLTMFYERASIPYPPLPIPSYFEKCRSDEDGGEAQTGVGHGLYLPQQN